MYQIAGMLISPVIGIKLDNIGRKNCILIGFLFIVSATLGFGFLANVDNE
jgi:MFS family permease